MKSWICCVLVAWVGTSVLGGTGDLPVTSSSEDAGLPGITMPFLRAVIHPNVSGVVQEILIKDGDRVRAGQPLVRMDDRVALANLSAAEVAAEMVGPLELAQAELAAAEQYLRRLESVSDSRAVAAQDFEIARAAVRKANANLTTATGNLRLAEERVVLERERLNQMTLVAPFDGIAHHIQANPGERLQENQTVLEVVNTSKLRAELHVPSAAHGRLRLGNTYSLPTAFRGLQTVEAKLVAIAPVIDPSTDTIRCVFEIENEDNQYPAGFLVHFGDN
jgi:RND family efflux transporter MFP subunit